MKDMIVTDYLSSCRPKMKRNENINPIFTCLHDDTEEMKKKIYEQSYCLCRQELCCIGGGSWGSSRRRKIGRVIDLHLDRRFFFLQLMRSFLQLKSRCRETTEDDVASCNDDVCVRNPGSPQRYVLAFCENGHVRNMPKRRFA